MAIRLHALVIFAFSICLGLGSHALLQQLLPGYFQLDSKCQTGTCVSLLFVYRDEERDKFVDFQR